MSDGETLPVVPVRSVPFAGFLCNCDDYIRRMEHVVAVGAGADADSLVANGDENV